jgi:integrase
MVKRTGKHLLDHRKINTYTKVGLHADGDGLYLKVQADQSKSWIYRYQINRHRRSLGLGGISTLSLAMARKKRDMLKLKVKSGIDPLLEKEKEQLKIEQEREKEKLRVMTFDKCAKEYIEMKTPEWTNKKHLQQWINTLETYANPFIGNTPVGLIEFQDIQNILRPIWLSKTETATRVRNRIELILDYAAVKKYRSSDNPARWRGNLESVFPKPEKIKQVKHHPALPYEELPEFMLKLIESKGIAAKALLVTILCATRTSETLQAEWSEFDFNKNIWVIPKERMKMNKEHRIPLSTNVIKILADLPDNTTSNFLFPGMKKGKPLSNTSMTLVLRRLGYGDFTVHGFRSSFRDWIAEQTNYPQRVAETALAHKLKDGAEAAYQRGDLLTKRAQMMEEWAKYAIPASAI